MSETRKERDTMGEVEVPADALWGAQAERARRNFDVSGRGIPAPLIAALGQIKAAAARVHTQAGRLDAEIGDAVQRAAAEVARGDWNAHFVVDVFQTGSGTSSNMNANEVIANRAGELLGAARGEKRVHPNDHVNLGQSSNDVFPSAIQVALLGEVQRSLLPAAEALADALHAQADAHWDAIKTGRTHLMDAMPIRFGQQLRGYAQQITRGRHRVMQAAAGLAELPLGGTAVGTGINAPAGFAGEVCAALAADTGLPLRETAAHFQAQSSVDAVVHVSGALRGFASALFKIANDLRWMASGPLAGLGEVTIPAVQPGSSIMPAKVNPVICESVLMACVQVMGHDLTIGLGNSQGQFELNTMLPLIGANALDAVRLLEGSCRILNERCVAGLAPTDRAADVVQRNPILATALAPKIGYEAAAKLAKEAAGSGRTVLEVAREQTDLDASELEELLDPAKLCGDHARDRADGGD